MSRSQLAQLLQSDLQPRRDFELAL